jgi:hypothetical protein
MTRIIPSRYSYGAQLPGRFSERPRREGDLNLARAFYTDAWTLWQEIGNESFARLARNVLTELIPKEAADEQ